MNDWKRAIGEAFEASVYRALSTELADERVGIAPRSARIHRKKGYYSKDRASDIITDVSIELFLPDLDKLSLIWVFECKAYTGTILSMTSKNFMRNCSKSEKTTPRVLLSLPVPSSGVR